MEKIVTGFFTQIRETEIEQEQNNGQLYCVKDVTG